MSPWNMTEGFTMKTRSILSVAAVIVCCVLANRAAATPAKAYEFIQTDRNVSLFHNLSDATYVGLRIVFAGDVTPTQAIGIGASFEPVSNEAGVLVYEGSIPPFGAFEVDWALDGPRVHAAFWIDTDGVEHPIDVHSPYARMWYEIPPGTDEWVEGCVSYVPIDIQFKGNWSKDPDGLPLVRYRWSWSDGLAIEGEIVERPFRRPGRYTVILTVWDVEGLPHSVTDTFYVHRYRCEEE